MESLQIFRNVLFSAISVFFTFFFIISPSLIWADTVRVPISLSYPFLNQLLILTTFDRPGKTTEISAGPAGCTKITLSEPSLSDSQNAIRLMTNAHATLSVGTENNCVNLMEWMGKAEVIARPVLLYSPSTAIGFVLEDVNFYNQQGERITSGFIWNSLKGYSRTILDRFQIDFRPSLDEIKDLLPVILPRYSAEQGVKIINSLRLEEIKARPEGMTIYLAFNLDMLPPGVTSRESILTPEELEQWEKKWQSCDAFLTFVIKRIAALTASTPLRITLLEILLDARYEFREALVRDAPHTEDPMRQLFARSWERLAPVLQEIGASALGKESLAILTFLTAGDTVQILDRLGPSIGLEISTDGLRRLARLIGESPGVDPLHYVNGEDPELRRLFGFDVMPKEQSGIKKFNFNFKIISQAFAKSSPHEPLKRLNNWVPTIPELDQYLPLVHKLLDQKANDSLKKGHLRPEVASIYQNLVLTASWQESCWRQYVIKNRKLSPLRSNSGDVGLMQVNEHVWRGFYTIDKLRWDIGYNTQAGCEILLKYLVDYALPKRDPKGGNLHNIARATYSAYNGGPSQINRFRHPNPDPLHKMIDNAFWQKYQAVQRGEVYNVAECLGASSTVEKIESAPPASPTKAHPPLSLKQEKWILAQNPQHFTLQIAALSTEKSVYEYGRKIPDPNQVAFYRLKRDGKQFYVVIYGAFTRRSDAEKAAKRHGFNQAWLRDFRSIQENIKNLDHRSMK